MKTKVKSWLAVFLSVVAGVFICQSVQATDWRAPNAQRDAVLGTDNNAPSVPSGPNPMEQMQLQGAAAVGTVIGNGLHDMLFGSPQQNQAQLAAQQAAEQARLAAQREQERRQAAALQFKNSGDYLFKQRNYSGAINQFQQALAQTPGDPELIKDIALAKQKIADTAVAAKNSGALRQLLGSAPADSGIFDFDQLTHSSLRSPNSSPLNLVNLDSDPNVVDLRGTTRTYVDPALVRGDAASKPADAQQTLNDLNNLLDNDTDKVKKQLNDFANNYLPHAPEVSTPTSSHESHLEIQNQKTDVVQTTKELDEALGQNQSAKQPNMPEGTETTVAENTQGGGNAGGKGLPGIYLNDDTGKGNNKPYGIHGLPGIYVNGSGEGSSLTKPESSPGIAAEPPVVQATTQPMTAETVSVPQPVVQPTEPAIQHRTIDLGNAGNPDFDGNMGGNNPITASGGSIPTPPSAGAVPVASPQIGGQLDIVSPGENLKDAVASVNPAAGTPFFGGRSANPQLTQLPAESLMQSKTAMALQPAAVPNTTTTQSPLHLPPPQISMLNSTPKTVPLTVVESDSESNSACGSKRDSPMPELDFMTQVQESELKELAILRRQNIEITGSRAESWESYANRQKLPKGYPKLPDWRIGEKDEKRQSEMIENFLKTKAIKGGDVDVGSGTRWSIDLSNQLMTIFPTAVKAELYPKKDGGGLITFHCDGTVVWDKPNWHIEFDINGY